MNNINIIPEQIENEPLEILKQRHKTLREVIKLQDMIMEELTKRKGI